MGYNSQSIFAVDIRITSLADQLFDMLLALDKNLPNQQKSGNQTNRGADRSGAFESDSGPLPGHSRVSCSAPDHSTTTGGLSEQLATLLHEQIHAWQYLFGKPGRRNYRNVAFRRKVALYGLQVNERGQHLGILPGRFTELPAAHGVDSSELRLASVENLCALGRARGESKLKKYSCPCGVNVRCAVMLLAQCLRCGGRFEAASPAW